MSTDEYLLLQLPAEAVDRQFPVRRGRLPEVATAAAGEMSPGQASAQRIELAPDEARQVARDPRTVGFAPVMPVHLHLPFETNDCSSTADGTIANDSNTWGVQAVGADTSPFSGRDISVAVLDTGIEPSHRAFSGVDLESKNFTAAVDHDVDGHGTHCAATILGQDVDGVRIGIARDARAIIAKVLHGGRGDTAGITQGLLWAAEMGADIISMSLGIDFPAYVERLQRPGVNRQVATSIGLEAYVATLEIYEKLIDFLSATNGAQSPLIVAAAGNSSNHSADPPVKLSVQPPAAVDSVLAVGAVADRPLGYSLASFSNINPDLVGPGVAVLSAALDGGLKTLSGTSMATPHVAGVAALWAQKLARPGEPAVLAQIRASVIAQSTLTALTGPVRQADVGAGLTKAPQL